MFSIDSIAAFIIERLFWVWAGAMLTMVWCVTAEADSLSFTMPVTYIDGHPLPAEPLAAILYRDDGTPVTGEVRLPGSEVRIWSLPGRQCWYVTARIIATQVESVPSNTACTGSAYSCGDGCHGAQL